MARRFNTAGPCRPDDHYMIPALRRLPQVRRIIDEKGYFVLHGQLRLRPGVRGGRAALCPRSWRRRAGHPGGVTQLAGLGLQTGWLVVFDQRAGLPPIDERTTTEEAKTPSGRTVTIIMA